MKLSFTTMDAFTSTRYNGNPVAVIRVPSTTTLTQTQKQSIASEFNLSEIVFLHLPPDGTSSPERRIDIFTSHAEVPFAGHPTIGTGQYLLQTTSQSITTLITKAGPIPVYLDDETKEVKAEIPHNYHVHSVTYPSVINKIQNPTASIVNGMSFILVRLPDLETLKKANGNLNINTYDPTPLDEEWRNGLLCTMYFVAQGEDEFGRRRYRTRMFGTREDPGTGSASSALGCYLAGLEEGKGPFRFSLTQGVEMGRRNDIGVEVTKKEGGGIEKVVLSGAGINVMEGSLEI